MPKKSKIKIKEPILQVVAAEPTPEDPIAKLQSVMGLSLETAFKLAVDEGAQEVEATSPASNVANVDSLPQVKKVKAEPVAPKPKLRIEAKPGPKRIKK